MMSKIRYIDMKSGLVKICGHARFDEAWYCSDTRPPTAQLLYDLGLKQDEREHSKQEATPEGVKAPLLSIVAKRAGKSRLAARIDKDDGPIQRDSTRWERRKTSYE